VDGGGHRCGFRESSSRLLHDLGGNPRLGGESVQLAGLFALRGRSVVSAPIIEVSRFS
jgi:hypothetical protein